MESTQRTIVRLALLSALVWMATPQFSSAAGSRTMPRSPLPPAFESYGSSLGATADNGFDMAVVNGEWRHKGHRHVGGVGRIASPWGEEMAVRFWFNPNGTFAVEYDRNAVVHYSFDDFGGLADVTVATETDLRSAFAGDRAQRAALGLVDPFSLDVAPYKALVEQLALNHSEEFLSGAARVARKLEGADLQSPVGCVGDILQCTGSILLWVATVPAVASACTVGSVVTLGAACLGAVLGHEGAGAVAIGACTNAIQNCINHEHNQDDPGGGCNGPGDGPE